MPLNWNDETLPSKADKTTDILGFKEIGGIGQLIYHLSDSRNMNLILIKAMIIVQHHFAAPDMNPSFLKKIFFPDRDCLPAFAIWQCR